MVDGKIAVVDTKLVSMEVFICYLLRAILSPNEVQRD